MPTDTLLSLFADPSVQTVSLGAGGLGAVTGAVGTFAVVRRQSLVGDAVSHAALPGVAVAFLLGMREPAVLAVGAAVAGWVAMATVGGIVRRTRVPFDTALAGALAVFFGFGILLMTYIKKHVPGAANHGLERYLFGQAAIMRADDLWAIAGFGGVAVLVLGLYWKELKVVAFDPDFAASLGLPARRLDLLLTTLVVIGVVVGLQAVGVVLMSALVVAPAVAARQWADRLGSVTFLAAAFGASAGVAGTLLSHVLSDRGRPVPTGPTIVLCATAFVVVSLLVAPRRGVLWNLRARAVTVPPEPTAG
jgi:manganese/zinc/iron transport system permease protein